MKEEKLEWKDGIWTYRIAPEGTGWWRFTGSYVDGKKSGGSDFGRIPGGAYVAIESLLFKASKAAQRP